MRPLDFGLWSTEGRYQLKELEILYNFVNDVGPTGRVGICPSDIKQPNAE